MIPKVCLNCSACLRFSDNANEPISGLCQLKAPWVFIQDLRTFSCAQRVPLEAPIYVLPDDNGETLASTQEEQNDGLESVSEVQEDAD